MKKQNIFKLIGIIAVVAIIGLSMTSCEETVTSISVTNNDATAVIVKLYLENAGVVNSSPQHTSSSTPKGTKMILEIPESLFGETWAVSVTPSGGAETYYGGAGKTTFKVKEGEEVDFSWNGTTLSKD